MESIAEKDEVYFSFNEKIINKNDRKETFALANGWQHVTGSIDDLLNTIKAGIAYSYWYADGIRKVANFVGTNIASIDIDGTNTIDAAIAHEFSIKHLTALYTTCSHTIDEPRFRLIFKMERVIESPIELKNILRALQLMYSGDPAATDAARIFFGNDSAYTEKWDRQIPNEVIDDLIKRNVEPQWDSQSHKGEYASSRSKLTLPVDTLLITRAGETLKFVDIKATTPVFCPYHLDKNASAFVGIKENGYRFLHCLRCQTSWHQINPLYDSEPTIKLDFVETLRAIKTMSIDEMKAELSRLPVNLDAIELHNANIMFSKSRFVEIDEFKPGLTMIKSPKGSGKTQSLTDIIESTFYRHHAITLEEFEFSDDDEGPPTQWETGKRVLLIGHRRALIRSMCQRLNLNCYLDEKNPGINHNSWDFRKRYGICLDSIKKIDTWYDELTYDLVIIDEVEQVLAHLLAETSRDAAGYLDHLYEIVNRAASVIAMDADLGWTSFLTLNSMRNSNNAYRSSYQNNIYINEYQVENKVFDVYDSKSEIIAKIYSDVADGKKVFVSTNSKKQVDRLSLALENKMPEKALMTITSDNSGSQKVIDFIADIKNESKKYDVVISSPSLGTGVDITFSDDEDFYDSVFGIYEALVNSHTEIDQQLSRVRHPKSVKVWISPRTFNFETNFDVIKADLITSNAIANTASDMRVPIADQVFSDDSRFLRTAALILSTQRESKNNLKVNFINYKKAQGWIANHVSSPDEKALGLELLKSGKELENKAYAERLLHSRPLHQSEFSRIEEILQDDDGQRISNSEFYSYQRMNLEIFYCRKLDSQMIEDDNRWQLRRQFWAYKKFIEFESIEKFIYLAKTIPSSHLKKRLSTLHDGSSVLYIMYGLLSQTQFFVNKKFDLTIEFNNDDLNKFADTCIRLKSIIETQMGINVRADVKHKANFQLGQVLKIIGIKTINSRIEKKDGKKIYFYKLEEGSFKVMNYLLLLEEQRQRPWDLINARYGFS